MMNKQLWALVCGVSLLGVAAGTTLVRADSATSQPATQAASQPAVIDATDTAALIANEEKKVTVSGTVTKVGSPASGTIFFVDFKGVSSKTGLSVVFFPKTKKALDTAFDGNVSKALKGKAILLTGHVQMYQDRPEIIINDADQVKVADQAAK
jgi:DNA/RNA endonuclease YhcR with UshA esterase domain